MWKGPDGKVRRCYPVVLAFQADYPEACLLTTVRRNQACPTCMIRKNEFANLQARSPKRVVKRMSKVFNTARCLEIRGDLKGAANLLQKNGLVNIKVMNISP